MIVPMGIATHNARNTSFVLVGLVNGLPIQFEGVRLHLVRFFVKPYEVLTS